MKQSSYLVESCLYVPVLMATNQNVCKNTDSEVPSYRYHIQSFLPKSALLGAGRRKRMVAEAKDEVAEDPVSELQQHLQLEAVDGRYLTKQEMLLVEMYQSFSVDQHSGKSTVLTGSSVSSSVATASGSGTTSGVDSSHGHSASSTPSGMSPGLGSISGTTKLMSSSSGGASSGVKSALGSVTTPRRQLSSDRERVQNFLAQRHSTPSSSAVSGSATTSGSGAKPAMSAMDRAKLLMAKKTVPAKPAGASSTTVKRINPLADILKGGSGSVVGGVQSVKRPRTTKSDKPGEIKINGGRSSIQV